MTQAFSLHLQLAQDTYVVTDLPLCRVLLMNEARYPWCILVPRRVQCREIHDLSVSERTQLWAESDQLNSALMALFQPDKLNMAALGNMVPQLHVHHIARFQTDAAWPAPVWGKFPPQAYDPEAARLRIQTLQEVLR